ncbi:MAG: sugar phosphate isomerase/epimerase [Candidatus Cryptobacteroides sp.]|nr:sugar phosphate isomerase/epimerase [Bacteroidales bacterium]MDY4726666.1 sugar phosphate isomerase/epimerase [Candidatus Cryptobacteroides sp.]
MRKITLILASLLALGAVSCTGGKQDEKPVAKEIGVQLYSIRDVIGNPEAYARNHEEAFKALAQMGYTSVEAACYSDGKLYGVDPEQYKADLEAAGLKSLSTHIGKNLSDEELASGDFTESMKWWEQAIAAHKAAGCKYVVCPSFAVPQTLAGLKTYCDYFNAIGAKCKENGMLFGYHNHSHEFNKVEDKVIYDFMLENTNPEYVFFEMDVYWAVMGHAAPVEYFKKYPGRFTMLHIKDYRELGESGMVGFDAIFNNAGLAGMKDFIVEIEAFTKGDWKESMKACADYLLKSDFVKATYEE